MQFPELVTLLEQHPEQVRLQFSLSADMPCFAGHFDEFPVLAGVVQIHWAVHWARQYLNVHGQFRALQSVKFQQLIRPPAQLQLQLTWLPERHALRFRYKCLHMGLATQGLILLTEPQ